MTRPDAVAVVVPARDEEVLLPACLDAVAAAVDALGTAHPDVPTQVVVVLDACRDGSDRVVRDRDGVVAVTTLAGCVGVARVGGRRGGRGVGGRHRQPLPVGGEHRCRQRRPATLADVAPRAGPPTASASWSAPSSRGPVT